MMKNWCWNTWALRWIIKVNCLSKIYVLNLWLLWRLCKTIGNALAWIIKSTVRTYNLETEVRIVCKLEAISKKVTQKNLKNGKKWRFSNPLQTYIYWNLWYFATKNKKKLELNLASKFFYYTFLGFRRIAGQTP